MKTIARYWLAFLVFGFCVAATAEASGKEGAGQNAGERPLIGITLRSAGVDYVRAVIAAGGVPLILPETGGNLDSITAYVQLLDGLVMTGGADIPPAEYGEEPHPTVRVLKSDRYEFEKKLGQAWLQQTDKPLLGICLGSQWLNVLHGGSLVQDIPSAVGTVHRDTSHPVELVAGSRLAKIFGATEMEVNSLHHQAVKRVGDGLRVAARAPDGVVEAVEATDPGRFLVGVQWHPEKIFSEQPRQLRLFEAFIKEAQIHRKNRQPSDVTR